MKFCSVLSTAIAITGLGISSLAHAEGDSDGKITFTGSIVDAPCSITAGDDNQKISLGQVSNRVLADGGEQSAVPFSINLLDCSIEKQKNVKVTFAGFEGNNGRLGITGNASGASILLRDGAGKQLKLGEATDLQKLKSGDNTLLFSAALKGDTVKEGDKEQGVTIVPGLFTAVTNFKLVYE